MDTLIEALEKSLLRKLKPWEYKYVEEYGEYCHSANLVEKFLSDFFNSIVSKLERELGRKLNPEERAKVRKLIEIGKSYERIKYRFDQKNDQENGLKIDF